ncbi:UDP-glucose 4-epimerase GalE [Aliarcobacter thereius]|uniref:UDP-glucose 4-epimerase n=1 Tax=Aliarcobacter thereius LMG 24486 TaxID=1032240 RepID=A0A1C7WQ96_9BACT|nr:UDP-glucose 4-epimerase GalE [Aliarcobacter thereius]OCL95936.1 UDP-glucose 4-epimerase [Aliarcobacter thereius LMG 24486]QBF16092.1 UDP-glucose 4-epimerase [Aliarcobacter thereius LMG 24486]TLS94569.1 UDP-glucose 4-epimerase GalE [Aliarcobacter thereius]
MILITGGAGYIATHTLVELKKANFDFVVYDNLSNSSKEALKRVKKITGAKIKFVKGDIRDKKALRKVFKTYSIDSVIHFAGLKAVGESVAKPLKYYDNNVVGTIKLLEVMREFDCKKIVFSSSATVYGNPKSCPIDESFDVGATTNPYGTSKYMIERILEDLYISDNSFKIAILRYFNPVGAHESGLIGENPNGIPNNLMPYISQVAVGKLKELSVFGSDYETKDGTGVRDYIHVVDLANAHVKAIEYLNSSNYSFENSKINIGTGTGYSVLDMIKAFERASGKKVSYKIVDRRAGDIASCYANPKKAKEILDWEAKFNLEDMCKSSWNWQNKNPNGYKNK